MRGLSEEEAKSILKIAENAKKPVHNRSFLRTHIIEIAQAVKEGKDTIEIDGRNFMIKHKPYYEGSVLVYPVVGFVPSGYLSYKSLENAKIEDQ